MDEAGTELVQIDPRPAGEWWHEKKLWLVARVAAGVASLGPSSDPMSALKQHFAEQYLDDR